MTVRAAIVWFSTLILLSLPYSTCWYFRHNLGGTAREGRWPDKQALSIASAGVRSGIKQFEQVVDHNDPLSNATFMQRYYLDDSFQKRSGPVLFILVGEGPMDDELPLLKVPPLTSWAAQLGAIIIALEHRYYGQSIPVPTFTPENMIYLSAQQALADAAVFAATMKKSPQFAGRKWLAIGCSYSGALSAWLRKQYSNIVDAAIAGGAVVHAQTALPQYLGIFANATGSACSSAVRQAAKQVFQLSRSGWGRMQLQSVFNTCQPLTQENLVQFFWAISTGLPIQSNIPFSGNPLTKFCGLVVQTDVNQTINEWAAVLLQNSCVDLQGVGEYNPTDLRNTSVQHFTDNGRKSWAWQLCTEFGWLMSNEASSSVFPWCISIDYLLTMCSQAFVPGLKPNVEWTNQYFGDRNYDSSSNILFVDGITDPWNWLTVKNGVPPSVEVINFNSAHCAPFFPITPNDPPNLIQTRQKMFSFLQKYSY